MKKHLLLICLLFAALSAFSQTPPPARLKYFGYAIVDCGLDDVNDGSAISNYTTEVDTFSNVAEMCVNAHTDTIINRVNFMNSRCMKPILAISSVFIYLKDNTGPSGSNYDLFPNYQTRWDSFKLLNASVLNAAQIEMFYVCDEPTWNGVNFSELSTICNTVKADFPTIPLCFVEAYTMVNQIQVPTNVDIIGFDHYGIYDVSTDINYLAWLDTLESKRSTPNQKMLLVFDEEWNSGYWPGGWTPDSMETVLDNYYKLALADTNVIALVGFTWPGLAPGWLGARSLPQHVIDKSVLYGQMIKNNYDPCSTGISIKERAELKVYPNPTSGDLTFSFANVERNNDIKIYNGFGQLVKEINTSDQKITISTNEMPNGIYFYRIETGEKILASGKLIKE